MVEKECAHCGEHAKKMKACAECLKTKYCSEKCQWDDWATHKEQCKKISMPKRERDDDDAQKRLEQIKKQREALEAEEKKLLEESRLDRIRKKKQDVARFKREIATRQERLRKAEADLRDLLKEERDAVTEKDISDKEKQQLKDYLKSLETAYGDKGTLRDDDDPNEAFQYYHFVDISTIAPDSFGRGVSFTSELMIGSMEFRKAFETYYTVWSVAEGKDKYEEDEFVQKFKKAQEESKVQFPPPPDIVKLMKKARITLTGVGQELKAPRGAWIERTWESVGETKKWGYKI